MCFQTANGAPDSNPAEVTIAIGYSARLLAYFPGAMRLADSPPFEPRKQPADVYRRLVECFALIQQIAERSKIKILTLRISEADMAEATPSDVFDIASLVVSELAYLHAQLPDAQPPRDNRRIIKTQQLENLGIARHRFCGSFERKIVVVEQPIHMLNQIQDTRCLSETINRRYALRNSFDCSE